MNFIIKGLNIVLNIKLTLYFNLLTFIVVVIVAVEKGRLFMLGKNTFGELGIAEKWHRKQNPFTALV